MTEIQEKQEYTTYEVQKMMKLAAAQSYARTVVEILAEQNVSKTVLNSTIALRDAVEDRYKEVIPENIKFPFGPLTFPCSPKDLVALIKAGGQ